MTLWHVTTATKLARYRATGVILPPVRAWRTLEAAGRFSRQTGRRLILRLRADASFRPLPGHGGAAVVSQTPYRVHDW